MKLYCVRHGEAYGAGQDSQCPLTPCGERQISQMAHCLSHCGIKIPHLIHSGKLRAQQTAAILADVLQIKQITASPTLLDCEADVADLLECLPAWTEDTLLVGHLPFMPRLINALLLNNPNQNPIIHYPPGTIVCLERQRDSDWIIRWVLNPEIVPHH